ncbi:MAG: ABC transporter ATP-binding protein [Actinomycetota bacterium]|nr:ABC transporter ATP-binding protein [Actinomycetota bacterium]
MSAPSYRAERDPTGSPLLHVRNLRITSRLGGRTRTIVDGIDLELGPGESIAIVGESGSGKSMTARALLGLLPDGLAATGQVVYDDRDLLGLGERDLERVRGSGIGLVLQDPFTMLNPLMRCGRHIEETLRLRDGPRGSRNSRRAEVVRRLAEVGITDPEVADQFPFQLSGGMRQRVGIAATLARDPRILVADEPTTALDVTTQREILALLKRLQRSRQLGLVLITHDLRAAFAMCDRVYVLYAGSLLEVGPAAGLEREPLHPYTLGLLLSEPPMERRVSALVAIEGSVPAPDEVATCCAFAPRCAFRRDKCTAGKPPLRPVGPDWFSNCVRLEEIREDMVALRRAAVRPQLPQHPAESSQPFLRLTELSKEFRADSGRRKVRALRKVSLQVSAGESVGLVGESGSGKTTLGRCIVGLETPTEGKIEIGGLPAADYRSLSGSDRVRLRRTVQLIFQDPYSSLNPARTVGFTLKQALRAGAAGGRRDGSTGELLERVGLPASYARRKPIALSGGERQRVAIARALAVRPRLIICDEPVSALDVSVQAQILNLFKVLREESDISFLFITHDLAVVRQITDRVYVLYRGEVVESGFVDEVLDNPQHAYTARLVASIPQSDPEWLLRAEQPSVVAQVGVAADDAWGDSE